MSMPAMMQLTAAHARVAALEEQVSQLIKERDDKDHLIGVLRGDIGELKSKLAEVDRERDEERAGAAHADRLTTEALHQRDSAISELAQVKARLEGVEKVYEAAVAFGESEDHLIIYGDIMLAPTPLVQNRERCLKALRNAISSTRAKGE
jgi:chromosome segregation ATPase